MYSFQGQKNVHYFLVNRTYNLNVNDRYNYKCYNDILLDIILYIIYAYRYFHDSAFYGTFSDTFIAFFLQ